MKKDIKKVVVLGASGNMGSLSGGIFAQAGIQCVFLARTQEKAEKGVENAVGQARSEVLRNYIKPATYEALEEEVKDADWVFEGLAEDMNIKKEYFEKVDAARKEDAIVSTVSSGLSVEGMTEGRSESFKQHFMGTHFYNPPGKLPANELIFHSATSKKLREFVDKFTADVLRRVNIETFDVPAFAGNRIGFQFMNEAAQYAIKHGVEKIDYLLGPFTGRAMAPLATVDLVGLDVHKAIVENVHSKVKDERHETYKMPDYMYKMIEAGQMGRKAGAKGGFYNRDADKNKLVLDPASLQYRPVEKIKVDWVEQVKEFIHDGNYSEAVALIKNSKGAEADIVRHFILGYISYSFHRIGEVTPEKNSIHGIDRVMSAGFSWLPASGWVDLLGGGSQVADMIKTAGLPVPDSLKKMKKSGNCKVADYTKYLIGR